MRSQKISHLHISETDKVSEQAKTLRQQIEEARLKKQDFMPLMPRIARADHPLKPRMRDLSPQRTLNQRYLKIP